MNSIEVFKIQKNQRKERERDIGICLYGEGGREMGEEGGERRRERGGGIETLGLEI